jgi:mono/diheme cytochrome c family protein
MNNMKWKIFATLVVGLGLAGCDQMSSGASSPVIEDKTAFERKLDTAQVARGKQVYENYCLECHGEQGKGLAGDWRIRDADGMFPPPPLDDSAHAWHHPTAALLQTIREGSPQGTGKMPAWKDKLSEQEMQDVVEYIKSLWSDPVYEQWMKLEQQSLGG